MATGIPIPPAVLKDGTLDTLLRPGFLERFYGPTRDAVVCIRGNAMYRRSIASVLAYDGLQFKDPGVRCDRFRFEEIIDQNTWHGSGLIIGTQQVNGRTEYLILTNNHVGIADLFPSNSDPQDEEDLMPYHALERAELSIVENIDDDREDQTRLEVLATDPDHDAALLRTDGASVLPVYPHAFGAPQGTLSTGSLIVTFGYPGGRERITGHGYLTALESVDTSLTSYLNMYYLADLKIDGGQSGSPVFVPRIISTPDGASFDLHLIGLVYGKSSSNETIRMITPWTGFRELVETRRSVRSKRPSLHAPVDRDSVERLVRELRRDRVQIGSRAIDVGRVRGGGYCCEEWPIEDANAVDSDALAWRFTADDDVTVTEVSSCTDGTRSALSLSDAPDLQERADRLLRSRLNHLVLRRSIERRNGGPNTATENRRLRYDIRVANEHVPKLHLASRVIAADLYRRGIIDRRFLS